MPSSDPTIPFAPGIPLTEDIAPSEFGCSRLGQDWRRVDLLALSMCERTFTGFGEGLGSINYGLTGLYYGLGDVGGDSWGQSLLAYP